MTFSNNNIIISDKFNVGKYIFIHKYTLFKFEFIKYNYYHDFSFFCKFKKIYLLKIRQL